MSDYVDRESKAEKLARKARAEVLNSGERGSDGLTDKERLLLLYLRQQGILIRRGWLVNERDGDAYAHNRVIEYA